MRSGNSICSWTSDGGEAAREQVAERAAQAADEEIGDAGVGRWRGGVERFEVCQQRELIQTREERSVRIVGIDRGIDGARERIAGQARQRVAADHVDLWLGLVLEERLIDLVLRALNFEGLELGPPGERQLQGLIERVRRRRAIGEVSRHERLIPHRRGPLGQHQPLQPVLRLGQRLLSRGNRLFETSKPASALRRRRSAPAFPASPAARCCATCARAWASASVSTSRLPEANARSQYASSTSVSWSITTWVSCASVRSTARRATRMLRRSRSMLRPRKQRLHVRAGQRRRKLRVEPRELVAGVEARRAEVDGVAAAGPRRATDQADAAVDLGSLEPAFRRAADRRRVGADVPLVAKVRDDSRVVHAFEDQHVLARDIGVEPARSPRRCSARASS